MITQEKDVVKNFKDHFEKIVEILKIEHPILCDLSDDPVLNATENFSQHGSVFKIRKARKSSDCFSFKLVTINKDVSLNRIEHEYMRYFQSF